MKGLLYSVFYSILIFGAVVGFDSQCYAGWGPQIVGEIRLPDYSEASNLGTGYGALVCPKDRGFYRCSSGYCRSKRNGEPDFVPQTVQIVWKEIYHSEFCSSACYSYSDSWRNGWKRSRCRASCMVTYSLYSKYYDCHDPYTEIIAKSEEIRKEMEAMYAAYQVAVPAKHTAALRGAAAQIEEQLEELKAQNEAAKKELELAESRERITKAIREEFEKNQSNLVLALNKRSTDFNQVGSDLEVEVRADKERVQSILSFVNSTLDDISREGITLGEVQKYKKQHQEKLSDPSFRDICISRKSAALIERARAHYANSLLLSDEFARISKNYIENPFVKVLSNYNKIREETEKGSRDYESVVMRMKQSFDLNFDNFIKPPRACSDFASLGLVIDLRIRLAETQDFNAELSGIREDFWNKFKGIVAEKTRKDLLVSVKREIGALEGSAAESALNGNIHETKQHMVSAKFSAYSMVSNASASGVLSSSDEEMLKQFAAETAEKISQEAKAQLSFENLKNMSWRRAKNTYRKAVALEHNLSDTGHALAPAAVALKTEIQSVISMTGGRVAVPTFASEQEYLDFDAKMSIFDERISNIEKEVGVVQ